jgi:aldehyde:ferredoxin oxidoreductase
MNNGYCGKILEIDLTHQKTKIIEISEPIMRKYMGGKGLIAYFMKEDQLEKVDPWSDENVIYYMTGVMTGIPTAGTSRLIMGTRSPMTNGFGMSESGGFVATELKKAGWDGLIVRGKSKNPVYLYIHNDRVDFCDATALWGKGTGEAHDKILEALGDKHIKMSQIGPAGERLVPYACVINDLRHACGRNGLGAVMGNKHLKAIAIRGTKGISFDNRTEMMALSKWYSGQYKDNPLSNGLYLYGTAGGLGNMNQTGILPTRNFREGYFEEGDNLTGQRMAETILIKREGCFACPVRCKRTVEVKKEDLHVDPKFGGPEYETIGAMGSVCGIGNLEVVAKAHERCNDLGIDTISAGMSIAFGMECYEEGYIDQETTMGVDLRFGNEKALLDLIEDIVEQKGFGKWLAQGVRAMSQAFGEETKAFALHVKGQELPMHDPRGKTGVGLGYAVSPTGADHMQGAHDTMMVSQGPVLEQGKLLGQMETVDVFGYGREKAQYYGRMEKWWSFLNMAGVCFFIPGPRGSFPIEKFLDLLEYATGWKIPPEEALLIGERGITQSRCLNLTFGLDETMDVLPERLYQPLRNGGLKGKAIDREAFQDMRQAYYEYMGWDDKGIPTQETLRRLGLDD